MSVTDERDLSVLSVLSFRPDNIASMYTEPTGFFYRPTAGASVITSAPFVGSGGIGLALSTVGGHEFFDSGASAQLPALLAPDAIRNAGAQFGQLYGGSFGARLMVRNSTGAFNFVHQVVNPTFSWGWWWKPDVVSVSPGTGNTILGNSDGVGPGSGTLTHEGCICQHNNSGGVVFKIVSNGVAATFNFGNSSTLKAGTAERWYFFALSVTAGVGTLYRYDFGTVLLPITNPTPTTVTTTQVTLAGSSSNAANLLCLGMDWSSTAGTLNNTGNSPNRAQGTIGQVYGSSGAWTSGDVAALAAMNPLPDTVVSGQISGTPTKLGRILSAGSSFDGSGLSHHWAGMRYSDPTTWAKNSDGSGGTPSTDGDSVSFVRSNMDSANAKFLRDLSVASGASASPTKETLNGNPAVLLAGIQNTSHTGLSFILVTPLMDMSMVFACQNVVLTTAAHIWSQASNLYNFDSNSLYVANPDAFGFHGGDNLFIQVTGLGDGMRVAGLTIGGGSAFLRVTDATTQQQTTQTYSAAASIAFSSIGKDLSGSGSHFSGPIQGNWEIFNYAHDPFALAMVERYVASQVNVYYPNPDEQFHNERLAGGFHDLTGMLP